MIGGAMYDHVVTIWGSRESRGPSFLEATRSWAPVPQMDRLPMRIQPLRETRSNEGPGERVTGEYKAFAPRHSDIMEGDVVEVLEGPEASIDPADTRTLKVDAARSTRHDVQLLLIDWMGDLAS